MTTGYHLPEGYRIEEFARVLRLYNPEGALLQEEPRGRAAAPRLVDRAWYDVWDHLEFEIEEELRSLREGTRSLRELKRVRQYLRLLDAVERTSPPVPAHGPVPAVARGRSWSVRDWLPSGVGLAAAAAALIATLATAPLWLGPDGEHAVPGAERPPAVQRPVGVEPVPHAAPYPPAVDQPDAVRSPQRAARMAPRAPSSRPRRSAPAAGPNPAPPPAPRTVYAVGFGEFASRAAAEIRMHLIRSKGYVVYVVQIDEVYHVLTSARPREHADRLAEALQEIGLPARALPLMRPQI